MIEAVQQYIQIKDSAKEVNPGIYYDLVESWKGKGRPHVIGVKRIIKNGELNDALRYEVLFPDNTTDLLRMDLFDTYFEFVSA